MATAAQASDHTKLGYIVQRGYNEFLSRNGIWTFKPEGIQCAFVHELLDLLEIAKTGVLKDAKFIYMGEHSRETRYSKAKSAAAIFPDFFALFNQERVQAYLNRMAAELFAQRRP
ncbi:MAG: hypothetical protein WC794_00590 [Candidatus Doudnabacteria bacterium]|jgi:hypothetical protein